MSPAADREKIGLAFASRAWVQASSESTRIGCFQMKEGLERVMSSDPRPAPALDLETLLALRQKAHNALALITDVRHGCNVTPNEIWNACEHLDSLISSLNQTIKQFTGD